MTITVVAEPTVEGELIDGSGVCVDVGEVVEVCMVDVGNVLVATSVAKMSF